MHKMFPLVGEKKERQASPPELTKLLLPNLLINTIYRKRLVVLKKRPFPKEKDRL